MCPNAVMGCRPLSPQQKGAVSSRSRAYDPVGHLAARRDVPAPAFAHPHGTPLVAPDLDRSDGVVEAALQAREEDRRSDRVDAEGQAGSSPEEPEEPAPPEHAVLRTCGAARLQSVLALVQLGSP